MRPSTSRASAGLVLLASLALASGAFAQPTGATPAEGNPAPNAATKADAPKPAPAAPATAAPEAKPTVAPAKTPGTEATVVNMKTIEGIMGKSVRSRAGNEDMGHIVDILVDGGGQIRAAVIDFGGFLGVGSRKVAVAWKTLDFADSIASGSVKVSLTRDQVRQAPEYKTDEPVVVLEGAAAAKLAPVPPPPGHNQDSPAH